MTVAGTRVSSACASKVASERRRRKTVNGGRRRGGSRLRGHLERESRGWWRRAEEEAAVLVTLGSNSRAAAMPDPRGASPPPLGVSWGRFLGLFENAHGPPPLHLRVMCVFFQVFSVGQCFI
jgi:hypothetical protein